MTESMHVRKQLFKSQLLFPLWDSGTELEPSELALTNFQPAELSQQFQMVFVSLSVGCQLLYTPNTLKICKPLNIS